MVASGGVAMAIAAPFVVAGGGFFGNIAGEQYYSLCPEGNFKKMDSSMALRSGASALTNLASFGFSTLLRNTTTGFQGKELFELGEELENLVTTAVEDVMSSFGTTHLAFTGSLASTFIDCLFRRKQ